MMWHAMALHGGVCANQGRAAHTAAWALSIIAADTASQRVKECICVGVVNSA